MAYDAILFDMDGTLLETGPLWSKATRIALAAHAIELTEEEHFSLGGILLADILSAKGHTEEIIESVKKGRDIALLPILETDVAWRTSAHDLLTSFHVPIGIITSAHHNVIDTIDKRLGIRELFDTIVAAEDVRPQYKPHPKGLFLACARLGVDPTQCVYIGDQLCDLDAAKNAGMDSILIRGTHTPKDLTHSKEAANFAELAKFLA